MLRAGDFAMNTMTRVWIDNSCIYCDCCVKTAPDVFALSDGRAVILDVVRVDAKTSPNDDERSALNAVGLEYQDLIREAAAGCPVEAIHCDAT
jgi:ferredoxin